MKKRFVVLFFALVDIAFAQLPLGTISNVSPVTCASGFAAGAACYSATVSCPNVPDIGVLWGEVGTGTAGMIVFVNGGGDAAPGGASSASEYTKAGFSFVQIAFTSDWEGTGNILAGACRPATMLNYFRSQSTGAYCTNGTSAGSAAVAYGMSWYGLQFDNVEFSVGPVFSDIKQGCEIPYASPVTVTPTNGLPFVDDPWYNLEASAVSKWTGTSCLPPGGSSESDLASEAAQSILQPGATLSFPQTSISAWDCDNALNPSAAQSYLFLQQVSTPWALTALSGCDGAEGTSTSVTPQGVSAQTAIQTDMLAQCHANRSTPVVTWATPAPITYGTALSGTQLSATANVAGSFVYSPPAGTVLSAGGQTLSVTFTPTETSDYTAAKTAVVQQVSPAATTVTWASPGAITYGTALSSSQLNATANVPGSFAYSPAAGTLLTAGTQTLSVSFTPTDSTDYSSSGGSVLLQVNPAATTVVWTAPAAISYGTALSAVQLNATASPVSAGRFVYTPPAGTMLGVGSQALSVSFTPTDSTDYSSSRGGTTLQVNPSALTVAAGSAYSTYGQPLPPLIYTITGFVNGDTQSSATSGAPSEGTAASPVSTPGVYPIAISQGSLAAANYNFMSFLNGTLTMQQAASTVAATSQNSSISPNQSTTLTATVSVTGAGAAPTQTVNFMLGAILLGTATLSAIDSTDSTATFTLNGSQLSAGGNSITAVYSGDANYGGSTSAAITVTLSSSPGNFGSVGVGTAASVETLVYNFTNATTLSAVNILTAGASSLDYTDGGSSNCTAGTAYSASQSCVVTVAFTPSAPGLRSGGVTLFAQGSNLPLTTWYLSGFGQSSAVTIDPGTQSTIATLSNNGQGYGSVIDGAGNVYVADHVNSQVIELAAGIFTQSVVVSSSDGLSSPTAVALDGAGNLYVSDTGNARVVMVPNEQGTLNSADMSAVNVSGLGSPRGLATDGSGNLYLADAGNGDVIEIPAGGGAPLTLVSGLTGPHGIAVDAAGNIYVAGNNQVAEYPVGGGTPLPMGSGYNDPRGVTVDASGALYVADSGNARIVRVAAGGAAQANLAIAGLSNPQGVALDAAGNVYVTDSGSVYEVNRAQAAPLVFGSTNVGSNSAPQTVTVSDAGNQPLNVSNLAITTNFTQLPSGGTDCTSSTQLSSGDQCLVAVAFAPTTSGALTGTLTLSANALNNSASMQTVQLSGSGAQSAQAITFPAIPPQTYGGGPVTLNATASSGLPVSYTVTAGPATVSGNLLTITGAGAVTVQANQAGNAGYAPATPISQSVTVGQGATAVVWSNPAAITYGTALNATQLNATATPISAGTYVYTPPAGTVLNAGSQILAVNFTPTDSTDYSPSSGSVTLQVNQASQTVTFPTIPTQTYGVGPITLNATANSGLTVSYAVTSGPATVSGNLLTITGAGAVTVQASQLGNANYAAATPVSQTFMVNQATQTITFTESAPASAPYNSSFTVAASASSALPVSFSSSGVCSNVGATFTMTNSTGTCTVTASQSGNNNYLAASLVIQSTTAAKAAQSVTFTGAPATAPYQSSFTVVATSNSGVTATITVSSVCSISGATVTVTSGSGTCTVTAKWAATTYYLAASASQSTTAEKAAPIVTFTGAPATAPYQSSFTVVATSNSGVTATITASGVCSISGTTVTMSSGSGTCTATAKWAATTYYLAASASQSTTAEKLPSTVTWATPAPIIYGTALSATQLNATANVAGSFVYSPRAGTVLGAGNQTLSVTLTPTLTQDYATATVKVTLTVDKTGTTTAVTSNSPNPSSAGKAVKVQFAVTPASGYGHPTGSVTVNASTGESCTATLTATGGSCSVTFKSEGSRTLTATYAGDSNDTTSVSAAVTQTVN
jgi:hypothetical protein